MKNIAVLTYSFLFEYANDIISGIMRYFDSKDDVRVFVAQIRSPGKDEGKFGYQLWNLTELLSAKDIDGYIVLTGTFRDNIKSTLKEINPENKPVVSLSIDLGLENSVYTICKAEQVYKQVIGHLKNKHGCSKIAYISGRKSGSDEAEARLQAFKYAMKENDLSVNEDFLFDSNFTQSGTIQLFKESFKTKDDVKFDAVLCANDSIGAGTITSLLELGVKIPDEVKVIGFDNSILTRVTKPTLSSIDQQMDRQGEKAAELIYDLLEGKEVPKENPIDLKPVYRQSCGCVSLSDNPENCKDEDNNVFVQISSINLLQQYNTMNSNNNRISYLFDCVSSKTTLGQYAEILEELRWHTGFKTISVYLYEEPAKVSFGEKLELKSPCILTMDINDNSEIFFNIDNNTFDVKDELFHKEMFEHTKGNYLLYPIFSGEEVFGYMLCKFTDNCFTFYEVCLKLISHTISRAKSYTESVTENVNLALDNYSLEEQNIDLHHESRIDELTQVLNRRGFMEEGQDIINKCLKAGKKGIVFFGDLDGLKTINDTYGHENGDIAIKTEAEILKTTFRDIDVVGRLSGDEFAIVTPEFTEEDAEMIQSVINDSTKKIVEERNITFPLSISIGYIEFDKDHSDLKELLSQADKGLYKIKHQKHGEEYFKRKNR